jgi:hypothetical protein
MTSKKQTADEVAALRAEVEAFKAAQPKPQPSAEAGASQSQVDR